MFEGEVRIEVGFVQSQKQAHCDRNDQINKDIVTNVVLGGDLKHVQAIENSVFLDLDRNDKTNQPPTSVLGGMY